MKETIKLTEFLKDLKTSCPNFNMRFKNNRKYPELYRQIMDIFEKKVFLVDDLFPYEFVECHEERGDGEDYDYYIIFKRKSDNNLFYLSAYKGQIEDDYLYY